MFMLLISSMKMETIKEMKYKTCWVVVAHAYNPSTWEEEEEAGGAGLPSATYQV